MDEGVVGKYTLTVENSQRVWLIRFKKSYNLKYVKNYSKLSI